MHLKSRVCVGLVRKVGNENLCLWTRWRDDEMGSGLWKMYGAVVVVREVVDVRGRRGPKGKWWS